jgi:K+-transporting ATPase KdpF subunit
VPYGFGDLVTGDVRVGARYVRADVCLRAGLRQGLKGTEMDMLTWFTAGVIVLLFVYLFFALVRPEWF